MRPLEKEGIREREATDRSSRENMGSMSSIRPPIGFDTFHAGRARGASTPEGSGNSISPSRSRTGTSSVWTVLLSSPKLARCLDLCLERNLFCCASASSFCSLFRFLSEAVSPFRSNRPISGASAGWRLGKEWLSRQLQDRKSVRMLLEGKVGSNCCQA